MYVTHGMHACDMHGQLETVEMENGNGKRKQSKLDANEF